MQSIAKARGLVPLYFVVLVAQFACGPGTRQVGPKGEQVGGTPARPALEVAQPIVRFVPASSELVVVVPAMDKLLVAVRAFEPIARQSPMAAQWLDALNAKLGVISDRQTWTRFGIDPNAALVLFSEGTNSTLLVPLEPGAQWQELASMVLASDSTLLQDAQGFVLALRWSLDPDADRQSWITAMQDAASGLNFAASSRAKDAARFAASYAENGASVQKEIWGHYDMAKAVSNAGLPCAAIITSLSGLQLHAEIAGSETKLHVEAALSEQDAQALQALLGPQASSGMAQLRDEEGASASLRMDLGAITNALRRHRCDALSEPLAALLKELGFAPTAIHFAGSRLDASELSGRLALDLGLVDKRYFASKLAEIPGRSLFESRITLTGQKVVKLGVPLMSTFYYQLSAHRLLFSTHKSMMTQLLAEPREGDELLFLRVVPARLPQLSQMLVNIMPRQEALALIVFARQFEVLQADVQLKDTRLLMEAQLRLVPPVL